MSSSVAHFKSLHRVYPVQSLTLKVYIVDIQFSRSL